jgi:hypothetical protein
VWDQLTDPRSREAIDVAEQYADGTAPRKVLVAAHRAALSAAREAGSRPLAQPSQAVAKACRPNNPAGGMQEALVILSGGPQTPLAPFLAAAIHDVLDHRLFRPVPFSPDWRSDTVVALARTMYEYRAGTWQVG